MCDKRANNSMPVRGLTETVLPLTCFLLGVRHDGLDGETATNERIKTVLQYCYDL